MADRKKITNQTKKHYRAIARDLGYSEDVVDAIMQTTYEDEVTRIMTNARKQLEKMEEQHLLQLHHQKRGLKYGKN